MQNPILAFRQSSFISEKPGYLSENWKFWQPPTIKEFTIFYWNVAHVSVLPMSTKARSILERACVLFIRKMTKKGKSIWKFGQKCTKSEIILKKGTLMCLTIAWMKQGICPAKECSGYFLSCLDLELLINLVSVKV